MSSLEAALQRHGAAVAAVLVEPMLQAAGGMIVWPSEFLAGVRRLCDRYGTLLIADEVLTGFGRTGRMFACEHAAIAPDIICLSKALTAGYLPLGATIATERLFEAFLGDRSREDVLPRPFVHGESAGLRRRARQPRSVSRDRTCSSAIARLEARMRTALAPLAALPIVGDVRVIGGVGIVELVSDKQTRRDRTDISTASDRASPPRFSNAASCFVRSATSSTSCRRT